MIWRVNLYSSRATGRTNRNPARARDLHGKRLGIGVAYLEFQGLIAHIHDFVSGCNNCHSRLPIHPDMVSRTRREKRDIGVLEALPRFENGFSRRSLGGPLIHVGAFVENRVRGHFLTCDATLFHHHHTIRATGQGSASHDFDRLPGPHFAPKNIAGANLAHDEELTWQFCGADGKSIAYGAGERGVIAVGGHIFRQYVTGCVE